MSSTYGANCLYHNMLIVKSWNFFQARLINNAHKFHLNDVLVGFSDGPESKLSFDSTLTWHFLVDSYSILLEESRHGLDWAQLFKTQTGSDSNGLTSDGS